ncbi:MAG: hypothetical protein HYZ53_29195 [Planctomycetes bacterium]|nr:hypothetical protein [Planctomycetota bacterium]
MSKTLHEDAVGSDPSGLGPPTDVGEFMAQHGLTASAQVCLALVRSNFTDLLSSSLALREDPETGDRWIALEITLGGATSSFMEAYLAYTREFLVAIPPALRPLLRLSYNAA